MSETTKAAWFIRHGQSETNRTDIYQAGDQFQIDPLDEVGESSASRLAERFEGVPVDVIISSSYLRALQTARTINEVTQTVIMVPVEQNGDIALRNAEDPELADYDSLFREQDLPSELEGLSFKDEAAQEIERRIKDNALDPDHYVSDEETLYDLWYRAKRCVRFIESMHEKRMIVVSHGGLLKMCFSNMLLDDEDRLDLKQKLSVHRNFAKKTWFDNTGVAPWRHIDGRQWQWIVAHNSHMDTAAGINLDISKEAPAQESTPDKLIADEEQEND